MHPDVCKIRKEAGKHTHEVENYPFILAM